MLRRLPETLRARRGSQLACILDQSPINNLLNGAPMIPDSAPYAVDLTSYQIRSSNAVRESSYNLRFRYAVPAPPASCRRRCRQRFLRVAVGSALPGGPLLACGGISFPVIVLRPGNTRRATSSLVFRNKPARFRHAYRLLVICMSYRLLWYLTSYSFPSRGATP